MLDYEQEVDLDFAISLYLKQYAESPIFASIVISHMGNKKFVEIFESLSEHGLNRINKHCYYNGLSKQQLALFAYEQRYALPKTAKKFIENNNADDDTWAIAAAFAIELVADDFKSFANKLAKPITVTPKLKFTY